MTIWQHSVSTPNSRSLVLWPHSVPCLHRGSPAFRFFCHPVEFPRQGKMKGMGQIITWSVRDESLHANSIIKLFHEFIKENPEINTLELVKAVRQICIDSVEHEDAFIDRAFEMGDIPGLRAEDIKLYIRWIADQRPANTDFSTMYNVPLPWLEDMLNAIEHPNLF